MEEKSASNEFPAGAPEPGSGPRQDADSLRTCARQLDLLNRIILLGNETEDLPSLLERTLDTALDLLNCEGGGIYLIDEDERVAEIRIAKGLPRDFLEKVGRVRIDEWPYSIVLTDKRTLMSDRFADFLPEISEGVGLKSIASVPLLAKGKVIGAINVGTARRYALTGEESRILESFGREAGTVIQRMQAEEALRQSEEKFRDLAEHIREVFWVRAAGETLYVNPAYEEVWGRSREDLYENLEAFIDAVHPADKERVANSFQANRECGGFDEEYRILRPDGTIRWIRARSFPVQREGKVVRCVGIAEDITRRREAEEVLRDLSARLLSAQEEERRRIARELHDGIVQTLAAIKVNVENVLAGVGPRDPDEAFRLLELLVPILENTMDETRSIYMGLRPSTLDDVGVIATVHWFCRNFQAIHPAHRIEIKTEPEEHEVPDPLKIEIFRVMQEALNNMAKHSRAKRANVSLLRCEGGIELVVEDDGDGFDIGAAGAKRGSARGLGLTSMRERVQLSGGVFTVQSASGKGTTVRAFWLLPKA